MSGGGREGYVTNEDNIFTARRRRPEISLRFVGCYGRRLPRFGFGESKCRREVLQPAGGNMNTRYRKRFQLIKNPQGLSGSKENSPARLEPVAAALRSAGVPYNWIRETLHMRDAHTIRAQVFRFNERRSP